MLTHYCFKEVLPKEFCDGILNVARELDSKEAEVFKEGNDIVLSEIRNNRVSWLANDELSGILELYEDLDRDWETLRIPSQNSFGRTSLKQ